MAPCVFPSEKTMTSSIQKTERARAIWPASEVRDSWVCELAMMEPGRATLTVQLRPAMGWKTAVGLEVSTATGLEVAVIATVGGEGMGAASLGGLRRSLGAPSCDSRFRFNFCGQSVRDFSIEACKTCLGVGLAGTHFCCVDGSVSAAGGEVYFVKIYI